jgi:hypothetical protein
MAALGSDPFHGWNGLIPHPRSTTEMVPLHLLELHRSTEKPWFFFHFFATPGTAQFQRWNGPFP